MADILNTYFCSVFTHEDLANMRDPEQLYRGEEILSEVEFTPEKVNKMLSALKPTAALGPDGVWTRILHQLADTLSYPLSLIFSKLFNEGLVPDLWRRAHVCPVYKKGTKGDTGNYRPVSLTCVLCKVMESLIRDVIVQPLSSHNLIRASQHGFMAGRSTVTNLLAYMETLTKLLDDDQAVDVLYLDFAKAFDKVPHSRLLAKCKGLGLGGKLLHWIEMWLKERKQRVILNGAFSAWADVLSGVPQGSVLGPTLFIIFINDIDMAVEITGSFLFKFADDTKVGMVVETESQRDELQTAIVNLEEWSQEWQMMFNTSKCHMLHLGRNNRRFEYVMGGQVLETVESEKDVGVLVHQSLKASSQCSNLQKKQTKFLVSCLELSVTGTRTPS